MGYTLARKNAHRNAQPTSHETFLLPSSGELENCFDCAPTSVFQRARFSWYFSFRSPFLHSRFVSSYLSEPAEQALFFGVLKASAKRKKICACSAGYHHYKLQILHVNGRTAKTSSWEPFHGSCSILKLLR